MTALYDTRFHRWGSAALTAALYICISSCGGSPAAPTPTPDPPALTCPANATGESLDGQPVAVTVAAPTPFGGALPVTVSCNAPEQFPVGTTTVMCTATDALARTATCSYTVAVSAVPNPPTLACPANIAAQSPDGQPTSVSFTTPTAQGGEPPVSVSCNAPSAFPVGTTTVTCTATDARSRSASCSFTVQVTVTPPPPTLACPANITTQSPDGLPVAVSFQTPSATGGAPPVEVSCNAPAAFPVGTTSVTCTATDALSRSATCGFDVRVLPAPLLTATKFLAFGDSLTAGEVSLSSIVLFLSPTDAYPYRLQNKLKARYAAQAGSISVVNDGMPGEYATDGGIARFGSSLYQHRPDVVLIMEGTNDLTRRTAERIVDALEGMVRDAQQRGVVPLLATVPPGRPGGRRDPIPSLIPGLNDQIRAMAVRQGVTLVDVYAGMDLSLIGLDDLHPTPQGYDVMADIFLKAIASALEVSQTAKGRR